MISEAAESFPCTFWTLDAGNGTIDRTELQLLAFNLGRLMNDDELEAAFNDLDADGSGSIDFDELFQWLNSTQGSSHSGAAQAALRASLTRRLLMRRAKAMKGTLDSMRRGGGGGGGSKAARGSIDVDVSWTWGDAALLKTAGADALRVDVTVDGSGKTAQVQDTSAEEGERAAVQLFMKLDDGVSDEAVGGFVGPLNAFMEQALEAIKSDMEDLPVSRAVVVGPLPLPAASGSNAPPAAGAGGGVPARCIALEVFLNQDPVKPALQAFEEFVEMAGDGSGDDSLDITKMVQKLLEHFQVSLASTSTLAQLLGLKGASGAAATGIKLDGRLSKSVLGVFQELAHSSMLESTDTGFEDDAGDTVTMIQHLMSVENFALDAEVKSEERIAAASGTALAYLGDNDTFKPLKVGLYLGGSADPLAVVRAFLLQNMGELLLPSFALEAAEAIAEGEDTSDEFKEIAYLLSGKPEGYASAADAENTEVDVTERAWRVFVWAVRWLVEHASQVHSIRLAGRGLGASVDLQGVDLKPLVQLADNLVHQTVQICTPEKGAEMSVDTLQGQIPIVLLAGAEPTLMDATHAWCAASGTEEYEDAFEHLQKRRTRTVVLPSGNAAVVEVPNDSEYRWRSALAEGNSDVLIKALQDDHLADLWQADEYTLRHKPRCIAMGVLRASDVPELTAAGGSGDAPSKAAQTTGTVMHSLLQDWQQRMHVQDHVDNDAKVQRLQPWMSVLVHEDVPVSDDAKASAGSVLRAALDLPSDLGDVRVVFADVGSGCGVLHGIGGVVDEAVREHAASLSVFGADESV